MALLADWSGDIISSLLLGLVAHGVFASSLLDFGAVLNSMFGLFSTVDLIVEYFEGYFINVRLAGLTLELGLLSVFDSLDFIFSDSLKGLTLPVFLQ